MKLIKVSHNNKVVHFFSESNHSIMVYQKIFELFCSLTTNVTAVNFINFLTSLGQVKTLNSSNEANNKSSKV